MKIAVSKVLILSYSLQISNPWNVNNVLIKIILQVDYLAFRGIFPNYLLGQSQLAAYSVSLFPSSSLAGHRLDLEGHVGGKGLYF